MIEDKITQWRAEGETFKCAATVHGFYYRDIISCSGNEACGRYWSIGKWRFSSLYCAPASIHYYSLQ
jgi:hypothetical protein